MSRREDEHVRRQTDLRKLGSCKAPLANGAICGRSCLPTETGRYLCEPHLQEFIRLVRQAGLEVT